MKFKATTNTNTLFLFICVYAKDVYEKKTIFFVPFTLDGKIQEKKKKSTITAYKKKK